MSQLDMFDQKVVTNKTETSKESAKWLEDSKKASVLRKKVYDFLVNNPSTDEEIELGTGMTHTSVSGSAGRGGLLRAGLVVRSGLRRANRTGFKAIVWEIKRGE